MDRTASDRSLLGWLCVAGLAALALLALERSLSLGRNAPLAVPPAALATSGLPQNYREALARIDRAIADARGRAEERAGEWLMHETLARRYLARGRLTGSFDDYAAANATLARAFAVAKPGTGPHMTQAVLDFTMHRLAAAERQLDIISAYAVPPDSDDLAEIAAMRGDIAFYRGRYDEAAATYDEADRLTPGAADFRRAIFHSRTGRPDLGEDYFDRVRSGSSARSPQAAANIELQHGIMDLERGRWDAALSHFTAADQLFPGHWLIEEHIAEVTALKGDTAGAEARYRAIVRRTGHPEFIDALAGLARQRGDDAAATAWTRRAGAAWKRRLGQFPEAAYGHALDHCMAAGDWSCALDLARRNHANRPYGEAKVLLARALLETGHAADARRTIETVLASPWRTAQTHAVAAQIYAALGRSGPAHIQRRLARKLDPHIVIPVAAPSAT